MRVMVECAGRVITLTVRRASPAVVPTPAAVHGEHVRLRGQVAVMEELAAALGADIRAKLRLPNGDDP